MADGHDSGRGDADPLERYFRPRPGAHAADDDGEIEGPASRWKARAGRAGPAGG
jgi:hypothetical protein